MIVSWPAGAAAKPGRVTAVHEGVHQMGAPDSGPWDSPDEELRIIDEELARLRDSAADLRRRVGEREDDPTDRAEYSRLIEAAEEQEALIEDLEARRERLVQRSGPGR
jgi:hypothetical protein